MRPLLTVIIIAHCLSGFKWHCTFINIVIMSSSMSWFQIYLNCRRKQGTKNSYILKGICRQGILPAKKRRITRCQEETAAYSSKRGKMFAPCKAKSTKDFSYLYFACCPVCLCHPIGLLSLAILFVFLAPHCLQKKICHCAWEKCHTNEEEPNPTTHTTEYVWYYNNHDKITMNKKQVQQDCKTVDKKILMS